MAAGLKRPCPGDMPPDRVVPENEARFEHEEGRRLLEGIGEAGEAGLQGVEVRLAQRVVGGDPVGQPLRLGERLAPERHQRGEGVRAIHPHAGGGAGELEAAAAEEGRGEGGGPGGDEFPDQLRRPRLAAGIAQRRAGAVRRPGAAG